MLRCRRRKRASAVERQHGPPLEPPPVALRDEVVLGENLLLEANGAGGGHRLALAVVMVLVVVLVVLVPVAMVGVYMPVAMVVRMTPGRSGVAGWRCRRHTAR